MDNTTQNTQMPPVQNNAPMMNQQKPQGGQGALIGSIVIIILILVGAMFVIKNTRNTMVTDDSTEQMMQEDAQIVDTETYVESQSAVSTSDEMSDIGTEIDSTNVDSVDYGVDEEFK